MSATSPIQRVQSILALQSQAGQPPSPVCAVIAALKDLCELHGTGTVDWRGGASPNQRGGIGGNGSGNGGRPVFRNVSGSSLSNSGSMPRINSGRSLNSTSPSNSSGGSPYTPIPTPGGGGYTPMRYQSKFKNSTQPVEDKILNNIILSKLNKFSGATYNEIRDFLYQILGSGEADLAEMIRHFMTMVFKKAASEEVYCPLYAKLLAEISSRYSVILEEMQKLQENYLEIFEDVEEIPEGGDNYAAFVEKNKEKRYRQGYSQFLAELTALEILDLSNLERTFRKLTDLMLKYGAIPEKKALVEEYADCLLRMSRVLKKRITPFFVAARASLLGISKTSVDTLLAQKDMYPSFSPKAKFILMDVKDNLTAH